jgi:putative chitinase
MTTQLSPHFALEELTVSHEGTRRGLVNIPAGDDLTHLTATAHRMEDVRALLGHPITVLSGFRSAAVNKAVGGSKTSAHMTGHAVDFICPGFGSPWKVAAHLAHHLTGYDQIIQEFNGWVHVGFGPGHRMQTLTARKVKGKTVYTPGIAS